MQTVKTTLFILMCISLLAACGHKGPLYLPDEEPASQSTVEQESEVNDEAIEDKEDAEKEKDKGLAV